MKDRPPAPVSCPHCDDARAERFPGIGGRTDYRCPTCGNYSISPTQEDLFADGHADPRKAQFVVDTGGRRWLSSVLRPPHPASANDR